MTIPTCSTFAGRGTLPETIAILVGGRSTEHDVSVQSYEHVIDELLTAGGARVAVGGVYYIDREGSFHVHRAPPWPRNGVELGASAARPFLAVLPEVSRSGLPLFSVLHGNEGEDGAWQGLAEIGDLVGNFGPVLASALAMHKFYMATLAAALTEVRVPRTIFLGAGAAESDLARAVAQLGARPCVVKPNRMGSSLLTRRYQRLDLASLRRRREELLPYDPETLVQAYITGQEYTAGCLEHGGTIIVLPILKVVTEAHFLGYAEKHERGLVRPQVIDPGTPPAARISRVSRELFRAFDFLGMCRLDYILGADDTLYFLEANTLPGLTGTSAYTLMLDAGGYGIVDLIEACLAAARARPRRRKSMARAKG